MVYCSLCAKEYDDSVKECLLSHCVSCGSTRIFAEKKTWTNPISIIFIAGYFTMIFVSIAMNMTTNLYFLVPVMAVFVGFAFRDATVSQNSYSCYNCQMQGSSPLTKVPTQAARKEQTNQIVATISARNIDQMKTGKPYEKWSVRNILMIVSLIIAMIGMVFGPMIQRSIEANFG